MSAGDILLTIVIWLYNNTLGLLPSDIGGLSLEAFSEYLESFQDTLVYAFSGIANIFPIGLFFIIISVVITGEILLFGIKLGMYLINLIRGSGA